MVLVTTSVATVGSFVLVPGSNVANASTVTLTYTSGTTWTVPFGVTSFSFDVRGGAGGTGGPDGRSAGVGGNFGRMQGTLAATAGTVIGVYPGGSGANGGGCSSSAAGGSGGSSSYSSAYNGGRGGNAGSAGCSGGGGGGGAASILTVGGTVRVVAAGAGGGGGANNVQNSGSGQGSAPNTDATAGSSTTGGTTPGQGAGGGSCGVSDGGGGGGGGGGDWAGNGGSVFRNGGECVANGGWRGDNRYVNSSGSGVGLNVLPKTASESITSSYTTSSASTITITFTMTTPSTPDLTDASDSGASNSDNTTNVTSPIFTGTATGGSAVSLWFGSTQISTCGTANATTGAWSCTAISATAGTHSVTVRSTISGVTTTSSALSVVIDRTAPTSSGSITPTVVSASAVDVSYTAADTGGGGLSSLQVFRSTRSTLQSPASCGSAAGLSGASGTGTVSCSLATGVTFFVYSLATDLAGNVETAPTTADDSVTRDTRAPTSSGSITPTHVTGSTVDVSFSANDGDGGAIASVAVFRTTNLDLTGATLCGSATGLSGATATGTVTCTGLSSDATYYVYTVATDAAGNVEAAPTSSDGADDSVIRDATAPAVSVFTGPSSPTQSWSLSFSLSFAESVSGFATGDLELTGTANCSIVGVSGSSGSSFTVSVTCSSDGTIGLTLKKDAVTDAAGNTGPTTAQSASPAPLTVDAQLNVTLESNDGSPVAATTTMVGGVMTSSPGTPVLAGYTFLGWSDSNGGEPVTFPWTHGKTADFTLYAGWTPMPLRVAFNSQGGTLVVDGSTVTGGSVAAPSIRFLQADPDCGVVGGCPTKRAGFIFGGWSLTVGGESISFTGSPATFVHGQTADFTLYALWTARPFEVTFLLHDGTTFTTTETETGALLAYPPPPAREGYVFDGWSTVPPTDVSGFPVRFSPPTLAAQRLMSLSIASEDPELVWPHNRRSAFTLYAIWRTASSPRNVWFYPGGAPSNVFDVLVSSPADPEWSPIVDSLVPGFPRSEEVYRVTARISVPNAIGQLDTVTMCWYKSDGDGIADTGVSDSCENAGASPQTEFEVVWDQLGDEFVKTGTNNYEVQETSDFAEDESFTTVEVYFDFKISNAMRAGNWTVKVTALDVSGEVRSDREFVDVATFVEMQVGTERTQQNFGTLAENSSSTINDMAVGSYTANTDADFTISGTNFETTDDRVITLLETPGANPSAEQAALDCNIGTTLTSPQRVSTSPVAMSANLIETGEQRDSSRRMSCRLTYGGAAPLALRGYSNTVSLTVGAR